jgi:hypothetical protein
LPGGIGWAVAIPHTEILAAGGQLTHCFSSRMVFQHLHCLERLRSPLAFGDTLRAKSKSDLGHGFSCNNHSTCRFAFCIMLSFSLDRIGRRALGSEKKPFLITLDWFFDRVNSTLLRIVVSPANAFHAKRGFLATRPNHVAADNLMSRFEATLNAVLRFPLLASSDRSAGFQPALPCRAPKQRRLRFLALLARGHVGDHDRPSRQRPQPPPALERQRPVQHFKRIHDHARTDPFPSRIRRQAKNLSTLQYNLQDGLQLIQ